jgi:ketosteroid isomerase-like protein
VTLGKVSMRRSWSGEAVRIGEITTVLVFAVSLVGVLSLGLAQAPSTTESVRELTRLETVWNQAHVRGEVATIDSLCADDLVVTVPEMPLMGKADILAFWKSGRARITRYETSDIRVQVYGEAAIVTGRLQRQRDFGGKVVDDDWRFTKTYVRRDARWRVVAYHASKATQAPHV